MRWKIKILVIFKLMRLVLKVFLNFVTFCFGFIEFWSSSSNLVLFFLLLIYFWVDCCGSLFGIDNTSFNFYQLALELVVGCSKRATSKCWYIDSQGWYYYTNLGMDHRYYIKGLLALNKGSPALQGAPMALRGVNRLS